MLPVFPRDKFLHLLAGAILYGTGYFLGSSLAGIALCIGFGAAKEIWDRATGQGKAELLDFLATCLGGALASLVLAGVLLLQEL